MNYMDAWYSEELGVVSYRSGLTVYDEGFCNGSVKPFSWGHSGGSGREVPLIAQPFVQGRLQRVNAFGVEINGMSQPDTWRFVRFEKKSVVLENGAEVLDCTVELQNALFPLRLQMLTRLDGTAVFERKLRWINDGKEPLNLSHMSVMGGILDQSITDKTEYDESPERLYSLGFFADPDWGREGLYRRVDLPTEEFSFSGRFRRTRHRHPMFYLKNRLSGMAWFAQLGYSCGYTFRFDHRRNDHSSTVVFSVDLDGEQPLLILNAGEAFDAPSVHIGCLREEEDGLIRAMHDHLRRSVFTHPESKSAVSGGLIECYIGPRHLLNEDHVRMLVDRAARVGADAVLIDAGWFCPAGKEGEWRERVGDWQVARDRFPGGLGPIREYIKSKGMLFGLWLDPERIGSLSAVAKAHEDWIARPYGGAPSDRVDLTNPAALAWVESELCRVFEEEKVDIFRLDFNVSSFEMDAPSSLREDTALRYHRASCDLYARLREKFPHMVFENCAGGGGRTDVEFVRNFTHTWVSDLQATPRGIGIVNGMTMVLPPERIDRLVAGLDTYRWGEIDAAVRSTLFGRPTLNVMEPPSETPVNPLREEFMAHTMEIFREYVRPCASSCTVYHHTPEIYGAHPTGTACLERSADDCSMGVLGVFALDGASPSSVNVYPRGIAPNKMYRISFDNRRQTCAMDGMRILREGLPVRIDGGYSSELILWKAL